MLSFAYKLLTDLGAPVIKLYLLKRRKEGREDAERFPERFGEASLPRPNGQLIWCHAASVGEAASLLALIDKLRETYPAIHILVTTGTVTSAHMLEGRLPPRVVHQYMPVDRAPYVKRFLDHWRPNLILWIESELWPNMLVSIRVRQIPAVLLNGRMSEKSFRNWYQFKNWAKEILGTFALCFTQTENEKARFVALGAHHVKCIGNLKYAAKALPCDENELTQMKQAMAGRMAWIMASTHRGEDEIAIAAHKKLSQKWPGLLTIIAPRHARRGEEIAALLAAQNIPFARRSKQDDIAPETGVYLADTMGELGLFYRLSPIACLGGSFVNVGGHNPIEAAQAGCAIIFGPHMHNFSEISREFIHHQAAIQLQSANELAFTLDRLFADNVDRMRLAQAARLLAEQKRSILEHIIGELEPWLHAAARNAA